LNCCPAVVFIDLDGTLWDHEDISQTTPPYTCTGDILVDSQGIVAHLHSGVRNFLGFLRNSGLKIYTLSWNNPFKALSALKCLGLESYFDGHAISEHPEKYIGMLRILGSINPPVKPCQVVYIDDRDIHVDDIRKHIGDVWFIHMWRDVGGFDELASLIRARTRVCREL